MSRSAGRVVLFVVAALLAAAASAQTVPSDVRDVDLHDLVLGVSYAVVFALGFLGGNQGGGVA